MVDPILRWKIVAELAKPLPDISAIDVACVAIEIGAVNATAVTSRMGALWTARRVIWPPPYKRYSQKDS